MPLQVVDAHRGYPQGITQGIGHAGSDQQGSCEAGTLSVCDPPQVVDLAAGCAQHPSSERQQAPDMVPRRQFRHNAAVLGVHVDLRVKCLGEEFATVPVLLGAQLVKRDASLIARGFNSEDKHGS